MSNDLIILSLWRKIFQNTDSQWDKKTDEENQQKFKTLLKSKSKGSHLQYHSKKVEQGDIFIAIEGNVVDGHQYIEEILAKTSIIIANDKNKFILALMKTRSEKLISQKIILVEDTKKILSSFSASYYSFPSRAMTVLGVTGTNGKTSVCEILKTIFSALNFSCGVIGTNGIFINDDFYPNENTTPIAIELQKNLYQMHQQKVDFVFMEVSSHALVEGRVDDVDFDGVAFTNISSEHLDFHGNLENYFAAKKMIFSLLQKSSKQNKVSICCLDSLNELQKKQIEEMNLENIFFSKQKNNDYENDYGEQHKKQQKTKNTFHYQIKSQIESLAKNKFPNQSKNSSTYSDYQLVQKIKQSNIEEFKTIKTYSYLTNLIGEHNGQNLTTALLFIYGMMKNKKILATGDILKSKSLSQSLTKINIKGRLQKVAENIFIDYAHSPDAVEKILKSIRSFFESNFGGRVVALFGCGGDRDKTKRSQMGKIACQFADYCFITSDNPRTEEPQKIIDDILTEIKNQQNYTVILDRKQAIKKAIEFINQNDILLVLGKGHEDYQIIGREKIAFNEVKIINEVLQS